MGIGIQCADESAGLDMALWEPRIWQYRELLKNLVIKPLR
jgi:hypothetical protein